MAGSLAAKVKVALVSLTSPLGPEVMVVWGAVVSGSAAATGVRAMRAPMLRPGWVALALRGVVLPVAACGLSEADARASRVLLLFGAAASHSSVIPAGGVRVPSALMAVRATSRVSGTLVVTDGMATVVDDTLLREPAWAWTGLPVSTPE